MIKHYSTFRGLADHFKSLLAKNQNNLRKAMIESTQLLEQKAKDKFGVYQESIGEYPAWPQLLPATQKQREHQGYSSNEPLLRDGALKNSIHSSVKATKRTALGIVGSDEKVMLYQEMGTIHIPPRPVLAPTAYENAYEVVEIISKSVLTGIVVKQLKIKKFRAPRL